MSSPQPYTIVKPSPAIRRMMYADGNTGDIIRVIMFADKKSGEFIDAQTVEQLRGSDDYHTLENIFWFAKRNVNYKPDTQGHEQVRSPGYLFQTAQGDCKSLSIAIGALCRAFGIPYKYRFVRQRGAKNLHHVYVVAECTDKSGRGPVVLDAVHRFFDSEPDYQQKVDLSPGQPIPAGIRGISIKWEPLLPLLLIISLWFAFSKQVKK